jgi:hypothetical protein
MTYMNNNERGSALVIALMAMVIMTLLAASFLIMSSFESESSHNEAVSVQAYYYADAAVDAVIHKLIAGEDIDNNDFPDLYEKVMGVGSYENNPQEDSLVVDVDGHDVKVALYSLPGGYVYNAEPFDEDSPNACKTKIEDAGVWGKPTIKDIDYDGKMDVLVGDDKGGIRRYTYELQPNGKFCLEPWGGWDADDPWIDIPGRIMGDVQVANIDGDTEGSNEIIVNNDKGELYCFDAVTGQQKWKVDEGGNNGSAWEPTFGDIDGDPNTKEIAYRTRNGVCLVDSDGNKVATIPKPTYNDARYEGIREAYDDDYDKGGNTTSRPLVIDTDSGADYGGGDSKAEIVFGDGLSIFCYDEDPISGDWVEKWRYPVGVFMNATTSNKTDEEGNTVEPGHPWKDSKGNFIPMTRHSAMWEAPPAYYDLDNDGDMEIIFSAADSNPHNQNDVCETILDDNHRRINEVMVDGNLRDVNYNGVQDSNLLVPDDIRASLWWTSVPSGLEDSYTTDNLPASDMCNKNKGYEIHSHRPPSISNYNDDAYPEIFIQSCLDVIFVINVDFNMDPSNPDQYWIPSQPSLTDFSSGDYTPRGCWRFTDFDTDGTGDPDFPAGIPGTGDVHGPPNFVNVDDDPEKEIIYGTMNEGPPAELVIIDNVKDDNGDLAIYERVQIIPPDDSENTSFHGGVAVADLNNDGFMEIVGASDRHHGVGGSANQYMYSYSLINMNLAKIIITADAEGEDGAMRSIEAAVRVQNVNTGGQGNYEIVSWVER